MGKHGAGVRSLGMGVGGGTQNREGIRLGMTTHPPQHVSQNVEENQYCSCFVINIYDEPFKITLTIAIVSLSQMLLKKKE